jgi:hypothetical protein
MRKLFRWVSGKFVELGASEQSDPKPRVHVIGDDIPETWNPVDGKHYTSKSAIRRVARERGLIEVGNDQIKPRQPDHVSVRDEFDRAVAHINSRPRR